MFLGTENKLWGAGEYDSVSKVLADNHKDLSLISRTHIIKLSMRA